jgi:hypothetical protein
LSGDGGGALIVPLLLGMALELGTFCFVVSVALLIVADSSLEDDDRRW